MSYPAFNRNWKNWGRILDMNLSGPHIILKLENETLQVLYRAEYENLKIHDWVALDEKNQLIKVAPSFKKPILGTHKKDTLKKWSVFLKFVRRFFDSKDFLELHTPSLVTCPGTEPTLDVFATELKTGSYKKTVFLPTSPELHLKKTLAMDFDKIYEIAKCYRNNEVTQLHQPEFWMLEWYRSFANLFNLQADVVQLVNYLCEHFNQKKPDIKSFTIRQLFKLHLDFDLTPTTTSDEFRNLALHHHLRINDSFSIDDLFFLLMLEKIEPHLPTHDLVFVEKYPPFQAALARRDHEGWAERFEVYWKGMELANAFDELNDPAEQRKRSLEDLAKRQGLNPIHLDEEFFHALESGIPPSAGIALGLERLFMAVLDIKKIEDLRLFPINPY